MEIPDPVELMEATNERYADQFVDEFTCMECKQRFDYEMVCLYPWGGPALCDGCLNKHLGTKP